VPSFVELDSQFRQFAELLGGIAEYVGLKPVLTSTVRSRRVQERLYRAYLRGERKYPAAPPGTSLHEKGLAFDMTVEPMEALSALGALWKSFGPGFRWGGDFKANDPIHFEYRA